MDLPNSRRLLKLVQALVRRPDFLLPYLRALPVWRNRPLDLELPWWSFAAIEHVRDRCRENLEVFEYGSGGSTVFFARRCQSVTVVEDHEGWHQELKRTLESSGLPNVELQLRPFDFLKPENFQSSDYLLALTKPFDLIVIDGQDWNADLRSICFKRAEQFVREGGMIVVDDSWRYSGLRQANRAKSYGVFESVGPCRVGVTSTDVYYY